MDKRLTKTPVLETITKESFFEMRSFWHGEKASRHAKNIYTRVQNPPKATAYAEIVEQAINHPNADIVSVRRCFPNGSVRWIKYFIRTMRESGTRSCFNTLQELENDHEHAVQIGDVEIKFSPIERTGRTYDGTSKNKLPFGMIRLARLDNSIFGYAFLVPPWLQEDFTIQGASPGRYKFTPGIWVPSDYKTREQRPASRWNAVANPSRYDASETHTHRERSHVS